MSLQTLFDLLIHAKNAAADRGIACYATRDLSTSQHISYATLMETCWKHSLALQRDGRFKPGEVILIHFTEHLDNITWFWAVLLSGCTPAFSSPLPNDLNQREHHLEHLYQLFEGPLTLTRRTAVEDFAVCPSIHVLAIEDLREPVSPVSAPTMPSAQDSDLAVLMLTSGSSGNAKAVCITHRQLLASLVGKESVTNLAAETSLLNWIGMDHVAALVETHFLAMYCGYNQVHIQATDVIADPLILLEMVTRHQVARTVAPNFMLAGLQKAIVKGDKARLRGLNLSSLTQLVSGGEANPVELCVNLDKALRGLGAERSVLQPAFGMTETCAGCTYNITCPVADTDVDMTFAYLGRPVGSFEIRVMDVQEARDGLPNTGSGNRGSLQIRGPQVFSNYYRESAATAEAFTSDGWFDTGDEAFIDIAGTLHLVGRIKDQIRINGISMVATDVEAHLGGLCIEGVVSDSYACFGFRPAAAQSERLAVLYLPSYLVEDDRQRSTTNAAIAKGIMTCFGLSPFVLPLDEATMQRSTLGKLARSKLRKGLERGDFIAHVERNETKAILDIEQVADHPMTEQEAQILQTVRETLGDVLDIPRQSIGFDSPWYTMGISSIHLLRLKRDLELVLGLADVPLLWLLNCHNIRELTMRFEPHQHTRRDSAADGYDVDLQYNPVIRLRSEGSKPPIWLFHPGVGEVLVFINLARMITDRPVYALRARGFNTGETFFKDINQAIDKHSAAIKLVQPNGPYALAGYSYGDGAMLAFETAKVLNEAGSGQDVRFLASLNLPPHIKFRMRQLDWTACALHLANFLGFLPEPRLRNENKHIDAQTVVNEIFASAIPGRLTELSLRPQAFAHWTDLAHAMQSMAREYEPSGSVGSMDVFYCEPLAIVAKSKTEWMDSHIGLWKDFSDDVRFHEVDGEHYTMIGAENVESFCQSFVDALAARGL